MATNRLKNRFKNRFISHDKWIEWFTAKNFKASVIKHLSRIENLRNKVMTIDEYFTKPIEKRLEIVENASVLTAPFWLERLKTAITTHSPIVVMFDKRLSAEYWKLIEATKVKTT